jgi:hypothetical protein
MVRETDRECSTMELQESKANVEAQPSSDHASAGRQLHGLKWALLISSILTSTFLFGLDTTIVADVQPAIVKEFDSIDRLPWISVAFLLLSASTTLFW